MPEKCQHRAELVLGKSERELNFDLITWLIYDGPVLLVLIPLLLMLRSFYSRSYPVISVVTELTKDEDWLSSQFVKPLARVIYNISKAEMSKIPQAASYLEKQVENEVSKQNYPSVSGILDFAWPDGKKYLSKYPVLSSQVERAIQTALEQGVTLGKLQTKSAIPKESERIDVLNQGLNAGLLPVLPSAARIEKSDQKENIA